MKLPFALGAFLLATHLAGAVEIFAHRGASHDAPENTLAAFKLGWEQKANAVELDIWLTKDGRIIVCHDADTQRTTGVAKKIAASSLAELRALDAGSWKGAAWKAEKLPLLEEVLAIIPAGQRLLIEIKCGPEALPELQRVIRASGRRDDELLVISFSREVCTQAKARFPKIPVLLLASFKQDKPTGAWSPAAAELIRFAQSAKLDGLNLSHKGPVDAAFVRAAHTAGLKLYAWTVNDVTAAKRLVEAGVDGITTDRPGWLREQLR